MNYVSFRCVPMPENETCRIVSKSYAIDVAQIEQNIAIVNAMEIARSALLESGIHPSCLTILEWIRCFFKFPTCLDTKLLIPCTKTCVELSSLFLICFDTVIAHIKVPTVKEHFKGYGCRSPESYHDGYDGGYFILNEAQCVDLSTDG